MIFSCSKRTQLRQLFFRFQDLYNFAVSLSFKDSPQKWSALSRRQSIVCTVRRLKTLLIPKSFIAQLTILERLECQCVNNEVARFSFFLICKSPSTLCPAANWRARDSPWESWMQCFKNTVFASWSSRYSKESREFSRVCKLQGRARFPKPCNALHAGLSSHGKLKSCLHSGEGRNSN